MSHRRILAADLYALGATLHCCLTGRDPYHADDRFAFPPVRQLNPLVPIELDQLVQRLVSLDERQRPTSATDVQQELLKIKQHAAEATTGLNRRAGFGPNPIWFSRRATCDRSQYQPGAGEPTDGSGKRFSCAIACLWSNTIISSNLTGKRHPQVCCCLDHGFYDIIRINARAYNCWQRNCFQYQSTVWIE